MPDREKVVAALECLSDGRFCACCCYKPYDDCSKRVARDALILLKEQKPAHCKDCQKNIWKTPVQSLVDHIKTAVDVDPWAQEMVEELLTDPQRRQVVFCNQCVHWDKESGLTARRCGYWERYTTQNEFCSHGCKTTAEKGV